MSIVWKSSQLPAARSLSRQVKKESTGPHLIPPLLPQLPHQFLRSAVVILFGK